MLKNNKYYFLIKKIPLIILYIMLTFFGIVITSCKDDGLKKIKVAEVAHSVFYAPQYVAISNGYFEEEGLSIELFNANGADKVTACLLSKDVEIGLQGPEPTIYLFNNGQKDYLVNFAGLTKTDGAFIFGRKKIDNFTIDDLVGKSILGGRSGGVPLMTLEYVIKQAGYTVSNNDFSGDVNVRTDVAFAAMAGAFLNGEGDFTTLFEPTASEILKSNDIFLLESVGRLAGEISYTAYSCTKSYLQNNKDTLIKFTRAIYKGQEYVKNNTKEEIARILQEHFKDTSYEVLCDVVERYKSIDAFQYTPLISPTGFDNLQNIMISANELIKKIPYDNLVNVEIAKKAME